MCNLYSMVSDLVATQGCSAPVSYSPSRKPWRLVAALVSATIFSGVDGGFASDTTLDQRAREGQITIAMQGASENRNQVVSLTDCWLTIHTQIAPRCEGPQDVGMLAKTVTLNLNEYLTEPRLWPLRLSTGGYALSLEPKPQVDRAFKEIRAARVEKLRDYPNSNAKEQQASLAQDAEAVLAANNISSRTTIRSCTGIVFAIEPGPQDVLIKISSRDPDFIASQLKEYVRDYCAASP